MRLHFFPRNIILLCCTGFLLSNCTQSTLNEQTKTDHPIETAETYPSSDTALTRQVETNIQPLVDESFEKKTTLTPVVMGEDMNTSDVFSIYTSSFGNGEKIPEKFTCKGKDISPAFQWSNIPDGTSSFALVCNDPDAPAGNWVHWVLYNIPADRSNVQEGLPKDKTIAGVGTQGINDFRKTGYNGACPPPGKPHRYYYTLYALKLKPDLKPDLKFNELEKLIKDAVLAKSQWMGTFQR